MCVHVCLATYIMKYKTLSHLSEQQPLILWTFVAHIHTNTHTHTHTLLHWGTTLWGVKSTGCEPRLSGVENHSFKHCWVSLWKLLNLPEPHLPYLQNRLSNLIFLIGLWGSDGLIHSQHFKQCLMLIRIQ